MRPVAGVHLQTTADLPSTASFCSTCWGPHMPTGISDRSRRSRTAGRRSRWRRRGAVPPPDRSARLDERDLPRLGRLEDGVIAVRQAVDTARRWRTTRVADKLAAGPDAATAESKDALEYAEEAHRTAVELHDVNWKRARLPVAGPPCRGDGEGAAQTSNRAIEAHPQAAGNTVIYVLNVMGLAPRCIRSTRRLTASNDRTRKRASPRRPRRGHDAFRPAHAYRSAGRSRRSSMPKTRSATSRAQAAAGCRRPGRFATP
jgi:hypothetical protein